MFAVPIVWLVYSLYIGKLAKASNFIQNFANLFDLQIDRGYYKIIYTPLVCRIEEYTFLFQLALLWNQ